MQQLERARLVLQNGDDDWALARDLSDVTLHHLYRVEGFVLPEADLLEGSRDGADRALAEILERLGRGMEQGMNVPLDELYAMFESPVQQETDTREMDA